MTYGVSLPFEGALVALVCMFMYMPVHDQKMIGYSTVSIVVLIQYDQIQIVLYSMIRSYRRAERRAFRIMKFCTPHYDQILTDVIWNGRLPVHLHTILRVSLGHGIASHRMWRVYVCRDRDGGETEVEAELPS